MAKLSLSLLYLRLFKTNKVLRWLIYLGVGTSLAVYGSTIVLAPTFCAPRAGKTWTSPETYTRCNGQETLAVVQAAYSVAFDLYLLFLPVPVIWNLQMPIRRRLGIIGVFTTGLL